MTLIITYLLSHDSLCHPSNGVFNVPVSHFLPNLLCDDLDIFFSFFYIYNVATVNKLNSKTSLLLI